MDGITPSPTKAPPRRSPKEEVREAATDARRAQAQLAEQRETLELRELLETAIASDKFSVFVFYLADGPKDPEPLKGSHVSRKFPRDGYEFVDSFTQQVVATERIGEQQIAAELEAAAVPAGKATANANT